LDLVVELVVVVEPMMAVQVVEVELVVLKLEDLLQFLLMELVQQLKELMGEMVVPELHQEILEEVVEVLRLLVLQVLVVQVLVVMVEQEHLIILIIHALRMVVVEVVV
jgi:hypothetical protein